MFRASAGMGLAISELINEVRLKAIVVGFFLREAIVVVSVM